MQNETVNRQWVLKARPQGNPTAEHFEKRQTAKPALPEGHILAQNLIFSFDASQRMYMVTDTYVPRVEIGQPMHALALMQVIESKNKKFTPGQLIFGFSSWQDYVVMNPELPGLAPQPIPPLADPATMVALIITGLTGYFGITEIGQAKRGETVVVSGAAGATGSIAVQIAKMRGCRVIGIAGGPKKCKWLTEKLGIDAAIDYKNENVGERIKALCPKGVDVYFDNVGGALSDEMLNHLAEGGRVVLCGSISQYKDTTETHTKLDYGYQNLFNLTVKGGRMQGFLVTQFLPRFPSALLLLTSLVKSGKLIQAIDMQEGFDQIPSTLNRMFIGANTGKQLLKVADPQLPVPSTFLLEPALAIAQKLRAMFKI